MDRSETVTVFNDLVVLAPGAIVDAPAQWTTLDAEHVRGVYTTGDQSVAAVLTFNAHHDLVDFVSQDRFRASADGTSFTKQEWSTPLSGFRETGAFRISTVGEGRWNAPAPEVPSPTSSSTSIASPTTPDRTTPSLLSPVDRPGRRAAENPEAPLLKSGA